MLSLNNLPRKNLMAYPGRTIAMLIFTIMMGIATFGGTLTIRCLRQGLETVRYRLGADILVSPESAKNDFDAQTILLQAEPGYFYMPADKLNEIKAIDGIELASPQMFLATTTASCCSAKLQIIAFDPDSDFTIQPWISETFGGARKMGLMDIIVGSNVTVYDNFILKLYDNDCHVIGQFAPTGSTLDNCVYTNFETIKVLIKSSFEKNLNKYNAFNTDDVISTVMIRIAPGYDIESVAAEIQKQITGISVTTSKNMVSEISNSLSRISNTVKLFIIIFWAVGLLMTVLIFSMMIHERKREFAGLRAIGAGNDILFRIVTGEALSINLAGGIIGIVISAVILIAFSKLIEQQLGIGFVLPDIVQILLLAVISLAAVLLAAIISVIVAVKQVSRIDAGLVLKEGD